MQADSALGEALRQAVLGLPWYTVHDQRTGGPLTTPASIDVAVVGFAPGAHAMAANVLFSREHPQGHVAQFEAALGSVGGLRLQADVRDAAGNSIAWAARSDWAQINFPPLHGHSGPRFVAPYPASLIKLMVAVGLGLLVDEGRCTWASTQAGPGGRVQSLAQWAEAMITLSDNEATDACVAALHAHGGITTQRHALHELFARLQLPTLRLNGTTPAGGWRNGDGAGVGQLQMTAWDTVRLLWWLDDTAPAPPWLTPNAPRLGAESRRLIHLWLGDQGLHEVLSSTALAGLPNWMPGLPAKLPERWLQADTGAVRLGQRQLPADVRAAQAKAQVRFAHKTGTTENYCSDAGIVRGLPPHRRHYIVALLSNLGTRYAAHPQVATTWCLPMLGARIDALMAQRLE